MRHFKENSFTHQSLFTGPGEALLRMYKTFCGSRGSCMKSNTLPQVMSLRESASVGAKDYSLKT